jgi:hypothetical protein
LKFRYVSKLRQAGLEDSEDMEDSAAASAEASAEASATGEGNAVGQKEFVKDLIIATNDLNTDFEKL